MTKDEFLTELAKLSISVNETQINQFEQYYELLVSWNEKINLTSITDKKDVYLKHFYDSATIVKSLNFKGINTFCDIGTGAGFPGLVLKILFPSLKVTLIDSLQKRIIFLQKVIDELGLNKIEVIHARAEEYGISQREKYDVVTARAVSNLPILLEYCVPLVKKNGYFVAMKANISEELEQSVNAIKLLNCKLENKCEFLLPKENSVRNILKFKKIDSTPTKYPRKFSDIKKKPL